MEKLKIRSDSGWHQVKVVKRKGKEEGERQMPRAPIIEEIKHLPRYWDGIIFKIAR